MPEETWPRVDEEIIHLSFRNDNLYIVIERLEKLSLLCVIKK